MHPRSISRHPTGMAAFLVVWIGQLISVLATNMSGFALTIWAFEKTGQATALALVAVFFTTPLLLISPLAGVMVDRYNRKLMMMISDLGAGLAAILILVLASLDMLEVWHLYIAAAVQGTSNAFQWPAFSAAISVMVPKKHYGRANGLMSLVEMGPAVISPLLAGALIVVIGLQGILLFDVITFLIAIAALLLVHIPQPKQTEEGKQAQGSWLSEAWSGFLYIFQRPSLLGLQLIFFFGNFFAGMAMTLAAPMILARTGSDTLTFGSVQSLGALGGIAGGILMSAWGGPKRRINGVLVGWVIAGIFGGIVFGAGQSLLVWGIGVLIGFLVTPIINGSNQAIWQAKVAPDLQGRVFSARRLIAWFSTPITPILAATLADFVLEPAMQPGGSLSATFSWLVGTGSGAGMALLVIFAGLMTALIGFSGYLFPAIRNAETILPDHQQDAQAVAEAQVEPLDETVPAA